MSIPFARLKKSRLAEKNADLVVSQNLNLSPRLETQLLQFHHTCYKKKIKTRVQIIYILQRKW